MNELQVIVTQKPAEISFNFEEIKQSLSEQMEIYKSMEVTEGVLAERKKDVATLKKIAKAIDDKRKEVKNTYMLPYEEFEKKAKELIDIIKEPIDLIEQQTKEFDEKRRAEKKQKALEYFNQSVGDVEITFEEVFQQSWLLAAASFKSAKTDIDNAIANRKADIDAIKAMGSEVEEKALATYKATKRLSDALKVVNDYEVQKKAILEAEERRRREDEERKKREEERRAREEQERVAREQRERELAAERERQAEIERIREEERAKARAEMEAKQEEIPFPAGDLESQEELSLPETGNEQEEIPFPSDEQKEEIPFPTNKQTEEKVKDVQETVIFKRYFVKATKKQHELIIKTLDGLGVQWQV